MRCGESERNWIRAQRSNKPPGRCDIAGGAYGMDADQIGARDHFYIVRAAPGYPAIVDADDCETMFSSLRDGRACRMGHGDHADIVATVVHRRHGSLVYGAHVAPWLA